MGSHKSLQPKANLIGVADNWRFVVDESRQCLASTSFGSERPERVSLDRPSIESKSD